jgi:hypothetical protein
MKTRVQRGRAQLRELLRACCRIELDRRGQITEVDRSGSSCGDAENSSCGCTGSSD